MTQKTRFMIFIKVIIIIFQIYFYENLFNPDRDSKIQNKKRLNKKTIETSLNELFVRRPTTKRGDN